MRLWMVSAALLLITQTGCGNEEAEQLELQVAELEAALAGAEAATAAVRAESAASELRYQREIQELRQTPDERLNAAVQELGAAWGNGQMPQAAAAADELRNLVARFPQEQGVARAQAVLERWTATQTIAQAIEASDFRLARRRLRSARGSLSEEQRTALERSIYEAENRPVVTTIRELENSGTTMVGKRISVTCQFRALAQNWVTILPQVRGNWESPEGLRYSFSSRSANNWMGFYCKGDGSLFQFFYAPRNGFGERLLRLSQYDTIRVTGRVVDLNQNNWVGVIVEELR